MALEYGYNEEQKMIAESAQKLFADLFPSAARRGFMADRRIPDAWRTALGESGLLGVCAPERIGGSGLGATDALGIMLAAGRHVVPWPVAESIDAAALLADTHPAVAREVIRAVDVVAFAPSAPDAVAHGGGWRLSGRFDAVAWGAQARWLIVQLVLDGGRQVAVLDLESSGVSRHARKSIDPCCPMARIVLGDVMLHPSDLIGPVGERCSALRTLLACAEMLGAAQACLDLAVDYMKVRKQFGQEIGRFQALKHIAANDALYIESMRLAIEYAAWAQDAGADDAQMALHIAKQYCSDHARTVAEDAIQCHGGIGFTWDYDLHLSLRRILRCGTSLGSASEHREAIAAALIEEFTTG